MEQYIQLFIQAYRTAFKTYPQLVAERKKPPFWTDLDNSLGLLTVNNRNWAYGIFWYICGAMFLTFLRKKIQKSVVEGYVLAKDGDKFTESLWTWLIYSISFIMSGYIVLENDLLANGENLYKGYRFDAPTPMLAKILYFYEISYYLHSCYAVFAMNSWKRDTPLMFVHHVVALILIMLSYWTRTYLFGILTMFLHDSCDVALEGSKTFIKLQIPVINRHEKIWRHVLFFLFIFAWFLNRLYYFPLIALTKSLEFYQANIMQEWSVFIYILVILLFIIYSMDIFWFMLIVKLALSSLFGGQKIDDIREIDEKNQSDSGSIDPKNQYNRKMGKGMIRSRNKIDRSNQTD